MLYVYDIVLCVIVIVLFYLFFFFQAEDGIRDTSVTGVQTCALPIYERQRRLLENVSRSGQALLGIINDILDFAKIEAGRSEERRVGKECRCRWSAEQ